MDPKRVETIYSQLGTFSVDLSADAWSLGPKYVHELIARTRGYLNSVSFFLQEILQERQALDRAKHAAETVFKIESDRLLAEDDRCRRQPNIDDRKATVNLILREQLTEINQLAGQLLDLSYVEKAVRHRFNELKATMTDIRAQRALIRDAIDSGSFYGDETATSRGSSHVNEAEIDQSMAELNDLLVAESAEPSEEIVTPQEAISTPDDDFSDVLEEASLAASPELPTSKTNGKAEDPDISRFLEGDDDLSNLFDDEDSSV
jgi:hypothetical protein